MTREEALKAIEYAKERAEVIREQGQSEYWAQEINWTIEAIDMAIEALERERTDEWCTDCKEYDMEKKCCPRFNRVIRGAMKREPSEDLISRAEAIEALRYAQHRFTVADEAGGMGSVKWSENVIYFAAAERVLTELPSADRPRGEWTLLAEERPVDNYEIIATVYWPGYGDSTIAVGHIDRFDNWHLYSPTEGELIKGFEVIAWKTLPELYKESDTK